MIATREEDPARLAREQIYSLRRILVRRLQGITRGVTRRERVLRMRRFAEEWQDLRSTDGLNDLLHTLATRRTGPRGSGSEETTLLRSLARAEAVQDLSKPARAFEGPQPVQALRSFSVEKDLEDTDPSDWSGQRDLFLPLAQGLP